EALDIFIRNFSHAKLVREVRSGADRSAMLVNRPQPAVGAAQKRERRHHHEWYAGDNWNKPGADQSPVGIKPPPAHGHVPSLNVDAADDGLNIRKKIRVRENHAFGIAG